MILRSTHLMLIARIALIVALMTATCGCEERPLCYDHSHKSPVNIEFDWSLAPEAEPSTMVVWFFPVDGSAGHRYEIIGDGRSSRAGFNTSLNVPEGTYRMVCHNGNTDNNIERGHTLSGYEITTYEDNVLSGLSNRADNAPRPDDTESQPVRAQASTLYAHTHEQTITIVANAPKPYYVCFTPREVTYRCNVRITGVENLQPGLEASAIITGAAECWHAETQEPGGTLVTVPFPLAHCGSDCLTGTVILFGYNEPPADFYHKLRVYTSYKYYYDFDITDQIHDAPDPYNIDVKVAGIKLPDNPAGGTGMAPGVSDWEDAEEEEIPM